MEFAVDDDVVSSSGQRLRATNYFRLVQLTMIEGTNVVRRTILSRLSQKKALHTILAERKIEFLQKGSGFNRQQVNILYPAYGNADLAKIDMTLWFALARKLRVIPKSYTDEPRTDISNSALLGTQVEWCNDLTTIHTVRNNLFHLVKPELDQEIFDDQWNRVTEALIRLDPSLEPEVDFERYRTAELNPAAAREFQLMIREQCLQEKCEELNDEVRQKVRLIQLILIIVTLVLLLVLAGVLVFVFYFQKPHTACDKSMQYHVVGNAGGLYFIPRTGWGAEPPSEKPEKLSLPVPYVIYTHTAEISQCVVTDECCNQVKNIQYLQMHEREDKFDDIGYHYLLDSKGIVYEARDIHNIPSAVYGWNRNMSSVAFIGNFQYQLPTEESIAAFDLLLRYMRLNKWISEDYIIYGMCECRPTESPGRNLYEKIFRSSYSNIKGHVKSRNPNYCYFNDTIRGDKMNVEEI